MRALLIFALFLGSAIASTCPPSYQMVQGIGCLRSIYYDIDDTLDDLLPKSRSECAKDGAHLPIIRNKEEDDAYGQLVRSYSDNTFIVLDLVCNQTSRQLEWIDGSSLDYAPANIVYDNPSLHDLCFDCVSMPYTATSDPKMFRWAVVAYIWDYIWTAICVIDCPDCVTAVTSASTRMSTAATATTRPTSPTNPTTRLSTPHSTTLWPVTPISTTIRPTTSGSTTSTDYCSCTTSKIYLDIVFVVDTSDDMTSNAVKDVTATIKSTLYGLTFGTGRFQSNVAALAFAENVQTVRNFGDFKSTKDISSFSLPYLGGNSDDMANAIKNASSMIRKSGRDFSRGVIVLFSNSFDDRKASNINEAAKAFKDDGGILITLDYSKGSGLVGLENLASPGYSINDTSLSNPDLDADLLYAFCDANCFCKDNLLPYSVSNSRGREVSNGGCYRVADFSAVYEAAKDNCEYDNGFVTTVHDDDKNFFLLSLFPPKARYWVGLKKNEGSYEWADGV